MNDMEKKEKKYEPPMMRVFRFDDTEKILTESGGVNPPGGGGTTPDPIANYAANALNEFMGGTNTTYEK